MNSGQPHSSGQDDRIERPERRPLTARALERTAAKQQAFLKALSRLGTVTAACQVVQVGRRSIYDWVERDQEFAAAFDLAREVAADILEAEARRRGVDGVSEPVYFRGAVVGHVQRFSDACLLAVLAAYRPERFRRRGAGAPTEQTNQAVVHVAYDHNLEPAGSD